MKEIKRLIKETFNLWVRKRWLKEVNKACDKYIKTKEKLEKRQKCQQRTNRCCCNRFYDRRSSRCRYNAYGAYDNPH